MNQNVRHRILVIRVMMLLVAILGGMLMGYVTGRWMGRVVTAGAGIAEGRIWGAVLGGAMTGGMVWAAMNRVSPAQQTVGWKIVLVLLGGVVVGGSWGVIGGGLGALIGVGNLISVPGAILMVLGILGLLSALRMLVKRWPK